MIQITAFLIIDLFEYDFNDSKEDAAVRIQEELEEMQLPKQYKRNGKDCFLDPYRKRLIEITPEEIVRQKIAKYCEEILKVPAECIILEIPMSKYVAGTKGRADIVIHQKTSDNVLYPLMVVECKQTNAFLTDKVAEQAVRYCDIIGADYFVITNGIDMEMFKFTEKTNGYQKLEKVLSYDEMVSRNEPIMLVEEKLSRFTLEQLRDIDLMREYSEADIWVFGSDTPAKFIPFAVNLYQALLDEEHKLPAAKFQNFEMVEDLGVRYYDYSNGGGGHFNGLYRSFLINDVDGDSQILSFSMFGTGESTEYDKVNTHRKSYTVFFVAIDKFKVSKAILEYNMDTFVNLSGKEAIFRHNGRISGLPSDELKEYVGTHSELIELKGKILDIGRLPLDRLLFLDGKEESKFMYSFMEYTLLRERFRNNMQKR